MAAKKTVTEKRKIFLKANHATINPDKLKPAERNIYNKRKAGLVRQENAIKTPTGKFASKFLENEILRNLLAAKNTGIDTTKINSDNNKKFKELAEQAGVTKKELKNFYEQNKKVFEDTIKNGTLKTTSKNADALEELLDTFKQKVFVNDGTGKTEVTAIEAKKMLKQFVQKLATHCNAADTVFFPLLTFDGDLIINIPNAKKFGDMLKAALGVEKLSDIGEMESAGISEAIQSVLEELYGNNTQIIVYIS